MILDHYDDVLRAPKRIHSIQLRPHGKRHALPRTVTWESVRYFIGLALIVGLVCKVIPLVQILSLVLASQASWVIAHLILPGTIVYLSLNAQLDGLKPHRWAYLYATSLAQPRWTTAGIPVVEGARYEGKMRFYWDSLAPRLHHGWISSGVVSTSVPVRFTSSMRHMKPVMRHSDRGQVADRYEIASRLEVRG